eukprot:3550457-Pleurochrysis_carterae.AAC.1
MMQALISVTVCFVFPLWLLPSHQDRVFSRIKSVFYPKRGLGPGCKSPLEFHAMLMEGLTDMNGGCEMLWQLANYDFSTFFDGCVSEQFMYYGCAFHATCSRGHSG